ncbi:hypothetical protein F4823DRAFT_634122 [Ustulina deusta]|nr:hypothetical protein F4823DRAFT_634122 [Ustulina deusta]
MTIIHGRIWANWCWRWAIVGSLLDSLCTIRSTKEQGKYPRAVVFQFAIASVETLLVIISPAIPPPIVAQYLTFGAIICHALWTALSASFWTPSRTRTVRLGASFGQGLGAVALIWSPLAFVVLFCSCSAIVYIEGLNKSRQPILPIAYGHPRINCHSTTESRRKYKVVFFGQGPERTQSLQRALDWPPMRRDAGSLITYDHPTRRDTTLISVHPRIESETDGSEYMRMLLHGATAVVLVVSLCNAESFKYIKGLKGFPEGQPGLLVGCQNRHGDFAVSVEDARDLAIQNGWDFAMANDIRGAFEGLVSKMFAKPHPKGRSQFLL